MVNMGDFELSASGDVDVSSVIWISFALGYNGSGLS